MQYLNCYSAIFNETKLKTNRPTAPLPMSSEASTTPAAATKSSSTTPKSNAATPAAAASATKGSTTPVATSPVAPNTPSAAATAAKSKDNNTLIYIVSSIFCSLAILSIVGPYVYASGLTESNCMQYEKDNSKACETNRFSRGKSFKQVPYEFPQLRSLYTDFELNYNPDDVLDFMKGRWLSKGYGFTEDEGMGIMYVIPLGMVTLYLLFLYWGRNTTSKNQEQALNQSIPRYWNLLLCVFSFWGASRTVPQVFMNLFHFNKSFEQTICEEASLAYGAGACGLAMQLFVLSKFPELVDTVLLVLKNNSNRVMFSWEKDFLHWYHHITVLTYCWNAYTTESAAGIYFGAMNFTVHAIMYGYYFCTTFDKKGFLFNFAKKFDVAITIMQTSQMFIGVYIVGSCIYYNFEGGSLYGPVGVLAADGKPFQNGRCNNSNFNLICGFIMYGSYLYLFMEFLVKKYIFKTGGKQVNAQKKIQPNLETSVSTDDLTRAASSGNLDSAKKTN